MNKQTKLALKIVAITFLSALIVIPVKAIMWILLPLNFCRPLTALFRLARQLLVCMQGIDLFVQNY